MLSGQSRVAESLIVLLHISVLRTDTSDDLDFAVVHALHLAESGRTLHERRIGEPDPITTSKEHCADVEQGTCSCKSAYVPMMSWA